MSQANPFPRPVQMIDGRPVVVHDGKPVSQAGYCDYIYVDDLKARLCEFAESGVKVFYLQPHNALNAELWGHPNPSEAAPIFAPQNFTIEDCADMILEMVPDARFYIRFMSTVLPFWRDANPDEMQTDEDGNRHVDASLTSEKFLKEMPEYCRRLVEYCENRPWGDRIVGYLEAAWGEGVMPLTLNGHMFDVSPANEKAFKAWVRKRYSTDGDLQKAWNDPKITLDTVQVPRDSEWLRRKQKAVATIDGEPINSQSLATNAQTRTNGLFHWIESSNAADIADYCIFMREAFYSKYRLIARTVKATCQKLGRIRLMGFDATKEPLMGWPILSNFDGIGDPASFPNILTLSGSWDIGDLLDDENIDAILTPADYTARTVGFGYEAEGVSDSLVLRGKTMLVENDARCYVGGGKQEQGAFRNEKEVEAGLLRNAAFTLSRGIQSYWCNVGSHFFHDAGIHRTIARLTAMLDRMNTLPHRETRDAIAFIIDDESLLTEDFTSGYQSLSVIWQRVLGLAHCGIPYRIYMLSDLRKDNFPDYRTFLFPNLFVVNDDIIDLLRRKVLRNGNLAIFGPATGISDGNTIHARGASRLLGVPMELHRRTTVRHVVVQDFGHQITGELPANMTYGDSMSYGPTITPMEYAVEDSGGTPLGHANACWFIHRTGLFVKEEGLGCAGNGKPGIRGNGDYGVMWSVAMPLPSNLLRAAARYSGCNVWCEEDDVIYASDSVVGIHSTKIGTRTIKLPRPCDVTDAYSNEPIGKGLTEITVQISPPDTQLFIIE